LGGIHRNGGWQGQLARVQRWHWRLVEADVSGSADLEDFAFAFFENCYHLREWIENTSATSTADLDSLFARSRVLRLCRDLCNGTKHLTITRASVDAGFSIGREYDPSRPSEYRLFIIADDKYDLMELAHECLRQWEEFLKAQPPGG